MTFCTDRVPHFNFLTRKFHSEGKEFTPQTTESEPVEAYDPEDTLLWYKGAPYVKSSATIDEATVLNNQEAGRFLYAYF